MGAGWRDAQLGLAVVDVVDATKPKLVAMLEDVKGVRAITIQFRYAFVACDSGLVAVDVTPEADGSFPKGARIVSAVPFDDAPTVSGK